MRSSNQYRTESCGSGELCLAGLIVAAIACCIFIVHFPILSAIIALSMIASVLFCCATASACCFRP